MLLLAGGMLAGGYLARHRLLVAMGQWLDVGRPPAQADYVMVLAGERNVRPCVAAALVNVGLARKVLVAHIRASADAEDHISPPVHEVIRSVLCRRGVHKDDIRILGRQAASTYDEARVLAEFLDSEPDARVIVVTNNFHTRRSRWILDRVLGDRARQVSVVSAPAYGFGLDDWWQTESGAGTVLAEYLKLMFYGVRYGQVVYWAAAVGVITLVVITLVVIIARRRRVTARDSGP